jgi:hypothetical protein
MSTGLLSLSILVLGAGDPDFTRDVRPILSAHCFKCHGPDESHRESGLRFDVREGAVAKGDSGQLAIVPGEPDASELIRRITSTDETEQMPPPSAKIPLNPAQIETLRSWIKTGAEYQPHWAFAAPRAAAPPEVRNSNGIGNPIDRFIRSRLERESLAPSHEADRETLIRRVTIDLIGLPPTPEEVAAFVADTSSDAYERLVDRLLASPRYGERWARRWLDLARYADTNGYEKDRQRSVWPYRDWVIRALNADKPFDQFTIDQIAGDLLPEATVDQRIATGFHRNTMLNEEGGIDPLEFRFHAMTDRVGTTGTTWLGLTVMCAQCHTHKFDPIPHAEYYELMAFLNNADEVKLPVPDADVVARREEIQNRIDRLEETLATKFPLPAADVCAGDPEAERRRAHLDRSFSAWVDREHEAARDWSVILPTTMSSNLPKLDELPDGSVLASGDQTKRDVYTLRFEGDFSGVTALRLEALPHSSLPRSGPGRTDYEGPEGDFFLSEITLTATDFAGEARPIKLSGGSESYAKLGIGGGEAGAKLSIDGEFQSGWSTSGREGEAHQAVWQVEPPSATASLTIVMVFERHYAADLGRFRLAVAKDPRESKARTYPADVEAALLKPSANWSEEERSKVLKSFLQVAPELQAARDEIAAVRKEMPEIPTSLVFRERPADNPRPTHVYKRGEFLSPTKVVSPGVLSVLNSFPDDQPRNRLGFARWLVSRDNPLTARVTVNRHWAALFGVGLVRTTGDFGYQGEAPSHPELLDWLAVDFMRDWSVKRLHKLIVMSATYRQSSRAREDQLQRDPENRLLSRGSRVRVDAEVVRDAALAAAGLLSGKMYGQSVFPPQPASITTEGAYGQLAWTVSSGEDRYRRGLYTFMKRTAPYAMFSTFDGPSGEACLARRDISNTPLQALTLLNDQAVLEAAQALGRAAADMGSDDKGDAERVAWLIQRCLSRPPAEEERSRLAEFAKRQRERFTAAPDRAATFAGGGTSKSVESATWTAVARAILNLDEFVTRE